jgi:hypothetical protein
MDVDYLRSLSQDPLHVVAEKRLLNLKAARESAHPTPQTSSHPPSSRAPWESSEVEAGAEEEADEEVPPSAARAGEPQGAGEVHQAQAVIPRKPGKPPGSLGVGRQQALSPSQRREHLPERCGACDAPFEEGSSAVAYPAGQELDLERPAPETGLTRAVIKHLSYPRALGSFHAGWAPPRCPEPLWWGVKLSEWRWLGPELLSRILGLRVRLRASRAREQEFLQDWRGLPLSIGLLQQCVL